jgi:hypothetical protein
MTKDDKTKINPIALIISLQQIFQMALNKYLPSATLTGNKINGNGNRADFTMRVHGLTCRITMEVLDEPTDE